MVNKPKTKYTHLNKTLTIAGIMLIFLAITASLFSVWHNRGFVYEPLDAVYYLRYLLILCGGYFIGYFFRTHQSKKSHNLFLFDGVLYSLLAILVFFSLDLIRAPFHNLFGFLPYPWEKILFEGSPLITLATVAIIAIIIRKYTSVKKSDRVFKWLLILLFIIQQISMCFYPMIISVIPNFSFALLWTIILGMISTPISIAIVTYLLLGNIKESLNRAFFSSLIGTIYFTSYLLIWEFSTNPMAEATEIFGFITTISLLALIVALIWRVRKTVQ